MSQKVFRDPLYNYVHVDLKKDRWLLDVIDCSEFQRLRRIHQLGVSYLTYPGADHNRLCHSLGVLHLMQLTLQHLQRTRTESELSHAEPTLLAAALVHDVGHGPFSHLFEPCLEIDHEFWSRRIILDPSCELHRRLSDYDRSLPASVAALIDPDDQTRPQWQKYLVSSQLDVDRLDYLRRDSLFTGAGYGHYDWFRLINTMEFIGDKPAQWEIVWSDKAKFAIEEYIFSRFYMYQNVYFHKTTRGFEQLLQAMWRRARRLRDEGRDIFLMPAIRDFWAAGDNATPQQYLAIEEFTVLAQIEIWKSHADRALSDLAARFLKRRRFTMIELPEMEADADSDYSAWEEELKKMVASHPQFADVEMYVLRDQLKAKYHQPYFPEKESDEQSVKNAIRVRVDNETPIEISRLLPRLQPITQAPISRVRYYLPKELESEAKSLRANWS